MFPRARRPMALLASLLLAGCDHSLGPEQMETATVEGRVHANGRPIGKRWIEFMPVKGTIGRIRSAPLAADGTFRATRVPVGEVNVSLPGRPSPPTGDGTLDGYLEYRRRRPLLTQPIQPGENPPLDIDLGRMLVEETRRASR